MLGFMSKSSSVTLIRNNFPMVTLAICMLFSPHIFAESNLTKASNNYLSQINQYILGDTYESSGSFGLKFGMSYFKTGLKDSSLLTKDEAYSLNLTSRQEVLAPQSFTRVSITKGTFLPLDFGAMASVSNDTTKAAQWGAHVQWTVYERFKIPTVAIRVSRTETTGLTDIESLRSDQIEIGTSYAPIPYCTISASFGRQWNEWKLLLTDYIEKKVESTSPEPKNFVNIGMKIQPFTPFINLSLERTVSGERSQAELLKLTFLL